MIYLGKHEPERFWRQLHQKNTQAENSTTASQQLGYAKQFYEHENEKDAPPTIIVSEDLFMNKDIIQKIKRLATHRD